MAAHVTHHDLGSDLVPAPVPCTVITPDADAPARDRLVLALHGGGLEEHFADQMAELFADAWQRDTVAPCTVAVPMSGRSFWIDRADGSQRWESFLRDELPAAVATLGRGWAGTGAIALIGVSMGGLGGLRLAFRQPDRYVAVAALEPGVEDADDWSGVNPTATGVRSLELFESFHGRPVDAAHFDRNHPTAIVAADHARIAASGLQIYLECGDEDMLGLHRGTERVHRALWDGGVPHEYHLVRGADHVGRTLAPRFAEAIAFLGRAFDPPGPDPVVDAVRQLLLGGQAAL